MLEATTSLAEVGSFSAKVLVQGRIVDFDGSVGRRGICLLEGRLATLSIVDIGEEIEVVVKEVYRRQYISVDDLLLLTQLSNICESLDARVL